MDFRMGFVGVQLLLFGHWYLQTGVLLLEWRIEKVGLGGTSMWTEA